MKTKKPSKKQRAVLRSLLVGGWHLFVSSKAFAVGYDQYQVVPVATVKVLYTHGWVFVDPLPAHRCWLMITDAGRIACGELTQHQQELREEFARGMKFANAAENTVSQESRAFRELSLESTPPKYRAYWSGFLCVSTAKR